MFNFDFQKTAIYRAVKITKNPLFRFLKIEKIVFLLFSIICSLFFLVNAFSSYSTPLRDKSLTGFNYDYDFLFGFSLIFFATSISCLLITNFVNLKLKNAKTSVITPIVNLAEFLSFETAKALHGTISFARAKKIFPINSTLFLYFLLKENRELSFILSRLLLDVEEIIKKLEDFFVPQKFGDKLSEGIYSEKFDESIQEAFKIAQSKRHKKIEIGDMFLALSKREPILGGFLLEADLRPDDVENVVSWWEQEREMEQRKKRFWEYNNLAKKGSMARDWASGYTITLDQYAVNWNKIVNREGFDEVIGYESEIGQVERGLSSPEINNVLLVGEPGVGLKNIVRAIALKSSEGQSLSKVNYQRVMELKIPQLLAQLKGVDEVEDILDKIFSEIVSAGNIILIIDDFHNFVGGEAAPGTINITGLLSSYLRFPAFQLIAITSYAGLHKRIEQNPSFLNLFSKVEVREPNPQETLRHLQRLVPYLEKRHEKFISYQALEEIIDMTGRYIADVPFPKKAKEVLAETAIRVAASKDKWVLPEHVDEIISQKTQIPVGKIEIREKELLLNLEGLIHQRIINQEEAVREIATALRRARAKLKVKKGPMGGFLFLGPTGVGKTETSKALAEIYFGSEGKMIRLDMSEFQSQADIPRLIGSSGKEGLLTTPVRENPFSLILLDEIEKAHPNILNLFLQVLDEGHITDGLGRKIDFSNTIIIATSNAGYKIILQALNNNLDLSNVKQKLLDYLFEKAIFRPELINRFDAVVLFKVLTQENLLDISHLMLIKIQKGLEEKNIEFIITEELKQRVVELGYDITFGARNLQRTIQDKVENPLAEALLKEDIKRGDKIEVTAKRFKVKVLK